MPEISTNSCGSSNSKGPKNCYIDIQDFTCIRNNFAKSLPFYKRINNPTLRKMDIKLAILKTQCGI